MIVSKLIAKFKSIFIYPFTFGSFHRSSRIDSPLRIDGRKNIFIASKCLIQKCVWLGALPLTGGDAKLMIADGVRLGHYNHIYATSDISIEPDVLTADRVYITDNVHQYQNIDVPIINQPIRQLNNVVIGEGSWIGENVCIIGASIGKHCVVGANSVITHDTPPVLCARWRSGSNNKEVRYKYQHLEKNISEWGVLLMSNLATYFEYEI